MDEHYSIVYSSIQVILNTTSQLQNQELPLNTFCVFFIFGSISKKKKENLYTSGLNVAQIWAKLNMQYQLQT